MWGTLDVTFGGPRHTERIRQLRAPLFDSARGSPLKRCRAPGRTKWHLFERQRAGYPAHRPSRWHL